MTDPLAYFERETQTRFRPTRHVGGGWNPDEQHIAPSIGLLAHAIETDRDRRHGHDRLRLTRLSCDVLGVLPIEPVDIAVTVLRPGRTIELVEAKLDHDGRTAVIARAWLAQQYDTAGHAGTPLPPIASADQLPAWDATELWPGGFVRSLDVRRESPAPGRGMFWLRTDVDLIAGEHTTSAARVLGLVDVANGMFPRVSADDVAFPNLDLTAHLFRQPHSGWTGFDTAVSFGPNGAGLTHSVLHDQHGPFGIIAQSLTVRPRTASTPTTTETAR